MAFKVGDKVRVKEPLVHLDTTLVGKEAIVLKISDDNLLFISFNNYYKCGTELRQTAHASELTKATIYKYRI